FHNRAAEVAAKLILNVLPSRTPCAIEEKAVRIKDAIAVKLVDSSVKTVRAAFGRDTDERAGAAAILCVVRIRADLEFVDRINRWARYLCSQLLHIGRNRIVVNAVKHE